MNINSLKFRELQLFDSWHCVALSGKSRAVVVQVLL
jgi:hypothetical protein